jgi:hypothetical protein
MLAFCFKIRLALYGILSPKRKMGNPWQSFAGPWESDGSREHWKTPGFCCFGGFYAWFSSAFSPKHDTHIQMMG